MGVGARRGGRARRAHHRRQHRQRQRRRHHHHHHHRRTGAHHGARITFPFLFGGRHQRAHAGARTAGGAQTTVTITSSSDDSRPVRRSPASCLLSLVVTVFLLAGIIVPFAVPAVPFPIGITCTILFLLIIVAPFVSNVVQTRKARMGAEPDVEAPTPAEEVPTTSEGTNGTPAAYNTVWSTLTSMTYTAGPRVVVGGPNGATTTSTVFYGNSTINMDGVSIHNPGGMNGGQPNTGYAYDPPPSFTEATSYHQTATPEAGVVDDTSQGLRPDPAGYPAGHPAPGYPATQPDVAAGADSPESESALDEPLPPPPSYEEAVGGTA
ncbi:uncharacterized protein LOC119738200 [Patiria miniata]|uniref:Uncharacterized protein n=1 Tax=Patiria miniata TaxID=46514 RepID=A0A914AZE3_PATMI|nr:uncharacterized protein LOC119738200 [Patiria miniata]